MRFEIALLAKNIWVIVDMARRGLVIARFSSRKEALLARKALLS